MRILYFHQHFSTPQGAAGTRSYEMAQALIRRGHTVTMVCGSYKGGKTGLTSTPEKGIRTGIVDGIEVIEICLAYSNYDNLIRRSLTFFKFALKSIIIAYKSDYDLLFATSTPLTAGIPGIIMKAIKPRKPFVFEVRDLWPELPKAMGVIKNPLILFGMAVLEWATYKCANACIGLSPGIVEGIRRKSGSKKQIAMIPNGCDIGIFDSKQKSRNSRLLASLGIPTKGFRAVFTGAHGVANGLHAVLDTADLLQKKNEKDIHLIFIGDGKEKPGLVRRAQESKLENCIFLDPIPKVALAEVMNNIDIGLMILANVPAFYYGTSPNKFFDYISSGIAVLNNYPGWLAEIITQNKCGIAVPPDDPESFADGLIFLRDHDAVLKEMSSNARNLAEKQFYRADLANSFTDTLESTYETSI